VTDHPTRDELRGAAPLVSVGVFAGDLADVGGAVRAVAGAGARMLHLDVGDGRYSPLMLGGPGLVASVRPAVAIKDVHLLVEEPLRHVAAFAAAGADALTVQLDSGRHLIQCLREIAAHPSARHPDRPVLRGVALPWEAQPERLAPLLSEVELVVVLGVVPGYPGAAGIGFAERVRAVRALVDRERPGTLVSADGGVTPDLAPMLVAAGADVVVAGSALFAGGAPADSLRRLQAGLSTGQAPGARQSGASSPSPADGSMAA
jgi:ribulose-phosphate 3-epimerase